MGNTLADAMANRAAKLAELLPNESKPVLDLLFLLQAAQRILLATMWYVVTNVPREPPFKVPPIVCGTFPLIAYIAKSEHTPVV